MRKIGKRIISIVMVVLMIGLVMPVNSIKAASYINIAADQKKSGTLRSNGQTRLYKFSLTSASKVSFAVNEHGTNTRLRADIIDSKGNVFCSISSSLDDKRESKTYAWDDYLDKGVYYIKVVNGNSSTTGYWLKYSKKILNVTSQIPFESEESSNRLYFGKVYSDFFGSKRECSVNKIVINKSGNYRIQVKSYCGAILFLNKSNGQEIAMWHCYKDRTTGKADLSKKKYFKKGVYYFITNVDYRFGVYNVRITNA